MSREFDYLLASVGRFFRPESPSPSELGLNWEVVLELADLHAVTGFMQYARGNAAFSEAALRKTRYSLSLSAELVKLADLFGKEKIDFIPLKGPVLGEMLYRNKGLKNSTDLDLLVRPGDALRAKQVLESNGYRLQSVPHWPAGAAYLRNVNHELSFTDPSHWLKLDLHWSLLPGYFPAPFDDAGVWRNAHPIPWGRAHLLTLSPERQLMFLCAHGAKHLWARLGWLCDLAQLIRVEPGMDWSAVFIQSRRTHTTRIVLLGLVLANNLLGVELPQAAAVLVTLDPRVPALAATVAERLGNDRPPSALPTTRFCLRALQKTSHRTRLVLGLLQPTEAEYRVMQMPPSLYWLYYFFRPLRLAAKYSRRMIAGDVYPAPASPKIRSS